MTPPIVEARGVTRRFAARGASVEALADVTLAVHEEEFVALIGPSGCGKSTLLKIVGGLLAPTAGDVLLKGRPVSRTPAEIGMMFQNPVLLEWRTVRANVELPLEISGGRRAVRRGSSRVGELLELVGLGGFEDRYPSELSGGMQQRVAICRMLITDPEILLLDEPFGSLDELTREHMNIELDRIFAASARAAILVTHNIVEAVFLSDRVFVMTPRPGRIAGVVGVPLAHPRDPEMVTGVEFQSLVREVREILYGRAGAMPAAAEVMER